jgi:hypothetical protein
VDTVLVETAASDVTKHVKGSRVVTCNMFHWLTLAFHVCLFFSFFEFLLNGRLAALIPIKRLKVFCGRSVVNSLGVSYLWPR